jgi:hypothetical protein
LDREGNHGRKEVGRHCLLAQHSPVQANRAQIFQIARPPRCPFCSQLHYPDLHRILTPHCLIWIRRLFSILNKLRRLRPSPTLPWHPTTTQTTLLSQPANENNPTLFQTSLSTVLSSTFILIITTPNRVPSKMETDATATGLRTTPLNSQNQQSLQNYNRTDSMASWPPIRRTHGEASRSQWR